MEQPRIPAKACMLTLDCCQCSSSDFVKQGTAWGRVSVQEAVVVQSRMHLPVVFDTRPYAVLDCVCMCVPCHTSAKSRRGRRLPPSLAGAIVPSSYAFPASWFDPAARSKHLCAAYHRRIFILSATLYPAATEALSLQHLHTLIPPPHILASVFSPPTSDLFPHTYILGLSIQLSSSSINPVTALFWPLQEPT